MKKTKPHLNDWNDKQVMILQNKSQQQQTERERERASDVEFIAVLLWEAFSSCLCLLVLHVSHRENKQNRFIIQIDKPEACRSSPSLQTQVKSQHEERKCPFVCSFIDISLNAVLNRYFWVLFVRILLASVNISRWWWDTVVVD